MILKNFYDRMHDRSTITVQHVLMHSLRAIGVAEELT